MLRLAPMSEDEFAAYVAIAVRSYAEDHVRAGDVPADQALTKAQAEYDELLPNGLRSPNQNLYKLTDDSLGAIGMLWFEVRENRVPKSAYLYDFSVREDLRGKGYGRRALELLEARLRELGVQRVSLNVFGHNTAARALYEKMGYTITGIGMKKELASR